MHVLPLPFGLALALLSRREAERIHKPKVGAAFARYATTRSTTSDLRYAELQRLV